MDMKLFGPPTVSSIISILPSGQRAGRFSSKVREERRHE